MLGILASLVGLACFGLQIYVVVKMFQDGQTGLGILGIFCGIVPLIIGWQKADQWNIRQVMMIWSGLIGLYILLIVVNLALAPHGATITR